LNKLMVLLLSLYSLISGAMASVEIKFTLSSGSFSILESLQKADVPLTEITLDELKKNSKTMAQADPQTGIIKNYKGILLSAFLERIAEVVGESKNAQYDLVQFKSIDGKEVFIPRVLANKYPLLLVQESNGLELILPWTTHPKILEEKVPVQKLFIHSIQNISLNDSKTQFSSLFLKVRTNPRAIRGEHLILRSCVGCHQMDKLNNLKQQASFTPNGDAIKALLLDKHGKQKGSPTYTQNDVASILAYAKGKIAE